jgi:hypothetical protein
VASKIKPSDVGKQIEWDLGAAVDFSADLLEDVNYHNLAAALRAINLGEFDIACDFIRVEKDQAEAGELTPDLQARRTALYERLEEAVKRLRDS